jgi:hypothetical protein
LVSPFEEELLMSRFACTLLFTLALAGCAEDAGTGTLQVMLRGEATITEGLEPGDGPEDVVDGWRVRFDKWIVTVGHVHIDRTDGEEGAQESDAAKVVDLRRAPNSGVEVARFEDVLAGRWDIFEFETPTAREDAEPDESVTDEDFDALFDADATYLLEGSIAKDDGESCPPDAECRQTAEVRFSLAVPAETLFGPCSAEQGLAGAVVNESGTTSVAITMHGDHIFFDAFPVGTEDVDRRAQWLADADLDGDDLVTGDELNSIDAADLLASTHSFTGARIPVDSAWDYVIAQLKTSGHFQGEGECSVDGAGHDHEH